MKILLKKIKEIKIDLVNLKKKYAKNYFDIYLHSKIQIK